MATILVVDDNSTSQRLMSYILRQHNHVVIIASNGRHALERLTKTEADLVLTDLLMPEMDGLALLEHLRADQRYKTLPIIVLTGSGKEQDYLRARAAGATVVLTKPVESEEILATVDRLVPQVQVFGDRLHVVPLA